MTMIAVDWEVKPTDQLAVKELIINSFSLLSAVRTDNCAETSLHMVYVLKNTYNFAVQHLE